MAFDQAAGDAGRRRAFARRDDDAHAVVAATAHGASAGVNHEADQEPGDEEGKGDTGYGKGR